MNDNNRKRYALIGAGNRARMYLYCLADLLGVESPVELKQQFDFYTHENRLRFNRLFDDTRG